MIAWQLMLLTWCLITYVNFTDNKCCRYEKAKEEHLLYSRHHFLKIPAVNKEKKTIVDIFHSYVLMKFLCNLTPIHYFLCSS